MNRALGGIRIVEWGDFISAPYCTKLLADLGAEVVKVERVKVPDPSKGYEDLGQPKQSDATRVTTSDGKQITVTDDGRRFK